MTSVADDETKVALSSEVNTGFDMLLFSCHDDIASVESSSACPRWIVSGQAGIVRLQWPELSDRMIGPGTILTQEQDRSSKLTLTATAHCPNWLVYLHTLPHHKHWSHYPGFCSKQHQAV